MLTNSVRTPCKARDFCLVRNSPVWRCIVGENQGKLLFGYLNKNKTEEHYCRRVFPIWGFATVRWTLGGLWRQRGPLENAEFSQKKLGQRCSFDPPCLRNMYVVGSRDTIMRNGTHMWSTTIFRWWMPFWFSVVSPYSMHFLAWLL